MEREIHMLVEPVLNLKGVLNLRFPCGRRLNCAKGGVFASLKCLI